jgi:micrococcal nuclease
MTRLIRTTGALLVLLALTATAGCSGFTADVASSTAPAVVGATVTRHTDGDTLRVRLDGGGVEKVRLIGVDTPEVFGSPEPYGREASAYTKASLPVGTRVWLEVGLESRDRYGRLLAYIWIDKPTSDSDSEVREKMFNARLLLDGFGSQMTIQPNSKYADLFTVYAREARNAGKGLWGLPAQ